MSTVLWRTLDWWKKEIWTIILRSNASKRFCHSSYKKCTSNHWLIAETLVSHYLIFGYYASANLLILRDFQVQLCLIVRNHMQFSYVCNGVTTIFSCREILHHSGDFSNVTVGHFSCIQSINDKINSRIYCTLMMFVYLNIFLHYFHTIIQL